MKIYITVFRIITLCSFIDRKVKVNHPYACYKCLYKSGGTAPIILNLSKRQGLLVSLTPWLLYPSENSWYPLNRGLGVTQNWSGHLREEINLLHLLAITIQSLGHPVSSHYD
jgi:hypothetical protein